MRIRVADAGDAAAIAAMIGELIAFERTGTIPAFTADQLARALTGPAARLHALVAEDDEGSAGFVSYTIDFAIWSGGDLLRVDDVFIRERARGRGGGRAMMLAIAAVATGGGMTCRWEIEPDNQGAQRFYRRLGVDIRDKKIARWSLRAMRAAVEP